MNEQSISLNELCAGFRCENIQPIPELDCIAYQFVHQKTGARCIHLFNDDRNNLFSIAFRTPVADSTGVAHILEHSVLAGSKKYPLKDPFKEMLKTSMQTFLNALTYPDRTLYPVASQVETDYFNLVDLYCDAVFNPLLTKNTFAQEGWHLDGENPQDPLAIKGIVFNEMCGVFSDFQSNVGREMLSELFPDTSYFFESGGKPEEIQKLTYEAFCAFHKQYYHPSNSFIVLYGNLPSEKTLSFIDTHYLSSFEKREIDSVVKSQTPWKEHRQVFFEAPGPQEDDGTATLLLNWMWGDSTNGEEDLRNTILSRYLLSGESAPLKRALLDSELGEDIDDMSGFDSDLIHSSFSVGLHKSKKEHVEELCTLVETTLRSEIDRGFDTELLEGAIRRIEFRLREIRKGGDFPYGLRLAEDIYRSWLYGGDPLTHIAFEKHLAAVKHKWKTEDRYFETALEALTLNNTHRLMLIAESSSTLGDQLGQQNETLSEKLSAPLSIEEKTQICTDTKELQAWQKREHSSEELACIPLLSREDIPLKNEVIPFEIRELCGRPWYIQPLFTARINYVDLIFDLSVLSTEELRYYPLYSEYLTRAGTEGLTSAEMAKRVNLYTGGISCSDTIIEDFHDTDKVVSFATFHGKAIADTTDEMLAIMQDILLKPDFSDASLLKNILFENRNDLQSSLSRSGHSYAVLCSTARILPSKMLEDQMDGLSQFRFLKELCVTENYEAIFTVFRTIHSRLINRNTLRISTTSDQCDTLVSSLSALINALPDSAVSSRLILSTAPRIESIFAVEVNSSVNYVTQSWKMPEFSPEAIGEYYLMARTLSTGYLWDTIRVEGGAYGGMALVGSSHPLISFASYRDPNLARTLDHFHGALQYIKNTLTDEERARSVTGAVGKLDIPRNPHTLGFNETIAHLSNCSVEDRQRIRAAILGADAVKLKRRAEAILDNFDQKQSSVFASSRSFDSAEKEGLVLQRESL